MCWILRSNPEETRLIPGFLYSSLRMASIMALYVFFSIPFLRIFLFFVLLAGLGDDLYSSWLYFRGIMR